MWKTPIFILHVDIQKRREGQQRNALPYIVTKIATWEYLTEILIYKTKPLKYKKEANQIEP